MSGRFYSSMYLKHYQTRLILANWLERIRRWQDCRTAASASTTIQITKKKTEYIANIIIAIVHYKLNHSNATSTNPRFSWNEICYDKLCNSAWLPFTGIIFHSFRVWTKVPMLDLQAENRGQWGQHSRSWELISNSNCHQQNITALVLFIWLSSLLEATPPFNEIHQYSAE